MHPKPASSASNSTFVAISPASVNLFSQAQKIAKYHVPVLITGETGTGKECIARYIHQHAFGKDTAPYVGVNCAAIPEDMLEAMLFGYEKGAFTGAVSSMPGKFELANGGTLLLDEIGDMPLSLQAKLLRVLQEQEVERLGSHKKIALNIRLIASTNKILETEIEQGRFRQDLFYRLSVVPIHILPLRERPEDILPLAKRFIRKYSSFSDDVLHLDECAEQALLRHGWPGNVRELENVIQRGIIMSNGGLIQHMDLGLNNGLVSGMSPASDLSEPPIKNLKTHGRLAEHQYIMDLLKRHKGSKSKTAQFLGITPRALRYRLASMRKLGIDVECISS